MTPLEASERAVDKVAMVLVGLGLLAVLVGLLGFVFGSTPYRPLTGNGWFLMIVCGGAWLLGVLNGYGAVLDVRAEREMDTDALNEGDGR